MVDNVSVGQSASVSLPTCRIDHDFQAFEGASVCYVFEQFLAEHERIVNLNRQLTALVYGLAAFVVLAAFFIFRASWKYAPTPTKGTHAPCRGRLDAAASAPTNGPSTSPEPVVTDATTTKTIGRGKKCSFGDIALESQSSSVRIVSDYTGVDSLGPEHELQFTEVDVIANEDVVASKKPAISPGSKRGSTGSTHQSPPSIGTPRFNTSPNGLYQSVCSAIGRVLGLVLLQLGWPSPTLLYGRTPDLSLIVIGSKEFKQDVEVLKNMLAPSYPRNFEFKTLNPTDILSIEGEIKRVCAEFKDPPGARLFIHLTGHGDENNKMIISGSKSIDEGDLLYSYSESDVEITVVADVCREGTTSAPPPPKGVSLIRTCSLGQVAGACRIKGLEAPHSCFLIALMMAACTPDVPYKNDPLEVQSAVQGCLDWLVTYLENHHVKNHPNGTNCGWCKGPNKQCPRPKPQKIDWSYAESLDGLVELMKILAGTETAKGVYQWFTENTTFCEINDLPDTVFSPVFDPSHRPPDHPSQHGRGAMSASVRAIPAE
ncbi:unnamed protein product [Rhizoctonia solani]|uniref:Uncharacterized protein n=1 Tax=Rhizoctonia solani TaxID=456999 RepID=A0A8H2XQB9_9AGAM|nr:unnamed protein product [Rhizoctonia solani]